MKIVGILGIVLFLFGGLLLIIGLVVCINTWTSDYASSACEKAAEDKKAFDDAKDLCGSVTSDCYRQATIGLTSEEECQSKTEFMNRQMIMGVVPAVIGFLLGIVGLTMAVVGFLMARKKKAAAAAA
jgi:ABC-type antimicrobial peptide transport system permease subunit